MSTDRDDTTTKPNTSHPDGGPLVILCAPTVDGGVKLRWRLPTLAVASELRALLARVGPRSTLARLPMSSEHGERWADCRRHESGRVTLDVAGEVKIDLRLASRIVELRLGAPALWREGYATIAARWIGMLGAWLAGCPIELAQAFLHGWEVTIVPIAVDTHGLAWDMEDAFKFTGRGLRQVVGRERATVSLRIGQRSSPVSTLIYAKTREISTRQHRTRADYEPVWGQSPDYDPARDVQRVELQLRGTGLEFMDASAGVLNLRDPFTLTRADALAAVWSYQTHVRRWIVPDCATRKRRAPTDPRWVAIQNAVSCPGSRLRQLRDGHRRSREQARDDALGRLWRVLGELAAVHGIAVERGGVASWLRVVAVMLAAYLAKCRLNSAKDPGDSRRRSHLWGEAAREGQAQILALTSGAPPPGLRLISLPAIGPRPKWPPDARRSTSSALPLALDVEPTFPGPDNGQ